MAVNFTREIEEPPDAITERLPGYMSRVFNPRAVWNRKYKSLVVRCARHCVLLPMRRMMRSVQRALPATDKPRKVYCRHQALHRWTGSAWGSAGYDQNSCRRVCTVAGRRRCWRWWWRRRCQTVQGNGCANRPAGTFARRQERILLWLDDGGIHHSPLRYCCQFDSFLRFYT